MHITEGLLTGFFTINVLNVKIILELKSNCWLTSLLVRGTEVVSSGFVWFVSSCSFNMDALTPCALLDPHDRVFMVCLSL